MNHEEVKTIMDALEEGQKALLECSERISDLESENAELKRLTDCVLEVWAS